jgi:hypothetical protein
MSRRHRTLELELTDAELKEFSGEHLRYEMQMLFIYRNILAGARRHATMEDTQRFAACLEAWAIHLRLLIDFLYDHRGQGTDAIASDFIEDATIQKWKKARPKKTADLQRAADRAGTQVAHLSYGRKVLDPWDNFQELTEDISDRLRVFVDHAAPTRLDPFFVEVFRHMSARSIDMSRLPPDASLEDLARLAAERPAPIVGRASERSDSTVSTATVISTVNPISAYGP